MPPDLNLKDLYFGTVAVKLAAARDLHYRFGSRLHAEPAIAKLLPVLAEYARELQQQLQNMGLTEQCRLCGGSPAGGCCSLEMTGEADAILLLANMLIGCQVAVSHRGGSECGFLDHQGCSLRLKPIFCLNYNCRNIRTDSSAANMLILARATGRLLAAGTELEQSLLAFLQKLISEANLMTTGNSTTEPPK
jgi:hypothetical protein